MIVRVDGGVAPLPALGAPVSRGSDRETVGRPLDEFDDAASATRRWDEGLRSVMRDVGVLETRRSSRGRPPSVGAIPLSPPSGRSWENGGEEWLTRPAGEPDGRAEPAEGDE